MAFISATDDMVALIDVTRVGARAQNEGLRHLESLARGAVGWPGFVSWSAFRGVDGTALLSYAQWRTEDELAGWSREAVAVLAGVGDAAGRWRGHARAYRIAFAAPEGAKVEIGSPGTKAAHTGLFAVAPENQAKLLELARGPAASAAAHTTAMASANFHRSLDGERVVNFGLWRDVRAFQEFARNPPFQRDYWQELAENEGLAYEHAFTVEEFGDG